jgi:hypothetical protein
MLYLVYIVYIKVNIVIMKNGIGYMKLLGIWRRFSCYLRSYCVTHLYYLLWSWAPCYILCTLYVLWFIMLS